MLLHRQRMISFRHSLTRCLVGIAIGSFRLTVVVAIILVMAQLPACAVSLSNELQPTYQPLTRGLGSNYSSTATAPQSQGGYVAAPVPNPDAVVPRGPSDTAAAIGPGLFQNKSISSDGFTPNSSQEISQQPKHIPLPGISLKVPLY